MSEYDMKKIRKLAQGHTMNPRPEAWKKLNGKLKAKRSKRRLLAYRNISIAAILISVLSITAVLSLYLEKRNPRVFSSNEQYRPVILEELQALEEIYNDPIYDLKYIEDLENAYTENPFKTWLRRLNNAKIQHASEGVNSNTNTSLDNKLIYISETRFVHSQI